MPPTGLDHHDVVSSWEYTVVSTGEHVHSEKMLSSPTLVKKFFAIILTRLYSCYVHTDSFANICAYELSNPYVYISDSSVVKCHRNPIANLLFILVRHFSISEGLFCFRQSQVNVTIKSSQHAKKTQYL